MLKRFGKYAVIGLQVSLLYWALLYCLTEYLHIWYMFSTMLTAMSVSLLGFAANSLWTWGKYERIESKIFKEIIAQWHKPVDMAKMAWQSKFVRYCLVGVCGTVFGWSQVYLYTEYAGLWYMHSSFIGTAVVMITTFIVKDRWIWGKEK
jgi:putative flippase GtrA